MNFYHQTHFPVQFFMVFYEKKVFIYSYLLEKKFMGKLNKSAEDDYYECE